MADISYTPTTWADGAEGGTPINSTRLNNIESGIVDAVAAIGPNDTTEDGTLKAQIDALSGSIANTCIKVFTLDESGTKTIHASQTFQQFFFFGQRNLVGAFWNPSGTMTTDIINSRTAGDIPIFTSIDSTTITIKNNLANAPIILMMISTRPFTIS